MDSLTTIFNRYKTDKNESHHNYCRQYDELVMKYRTLEIRLLEIGVKKGESLKCWRDAFPNAKAIVGLDINPECAQYTNASINIHVEIGNASDKAVLERLSQVYGPFDIILDDGSHVNRDVILAFQNGFPLLNDNGLYIVEDTTVENVSLFCDPNYPKHTVFFRNLIRFLNQSRKTSSTVGPFDLCADPFKITKKTANVLEQGIDKLEFGCGYIAVHKKVRPHWVP